MRLRYVAIVAVLVGRQAVAQGPQDAAALYEDGFLGSMVKLTSWIDTLDARFDALIAREKSKQAARRLDRLAKGLYRLCASKEDLALSLSSPMATDDEIRQDGDQIRRDLSDVRERFNQLGEVIVRAGGAANLAIESDIRNGLGGKAVLVDQIVFRLRQPGFNRSRITAQARQAASLCRQAQQAATLAAARVASG